MESNLSFYYVLTQWDEGNKAPVTQLKLLVAEYPIILFIAYIIVLVTVILLVVLLCLKAIVRAKVKQFLTKFKFSFFIDMFKNSFLLLSLALFIELYLTLNAEVVNSVRATIMILMVLSLNLLVIMIGVKLIQKRKVLSEDRIQKKYGNAYLGLKLYSKMALIFFP